MVRCQVKVALGLLVVEADLVTPESVGKSSGLDAGVHLGEHLRGRLETVDRGLREPPQEDQRQVADVRADVEDRLDVLIDREQAR